MQSTLGATVLISIAATAVGALAGALVEPISREIFWCLQRLYLCWDSCRPHFAWREARIGMRASRSLLSCSFRVQTLHGLLHSIASSKSRLESWSLWRS